MDSEPYLSRLTVRLADGLSRLPADFRNRQSIYLAASQNTDGGFSGREGGSDLYYTGFALRGLAVLDTLTPEIANRAASYLSANLTAQTSVIDFFSFLYAALLIQVSGGRDVLADAPSDWPERVAATLETFRTPDGGYNKSPGASAGSTYHAFLVGLCYQLLNRSLPRPGDAANFVLARQREDGGFVEVTQMRKSGTNPTAAAIGLLQLVAEDGKGISNEVRTGVVDFLAEMAGEDGGLRANGRVPLSDLLSTFTGMWTLHELGGLDRVNREKVRRFAAELVKANGGFLGGLWDEATDVEYTFYGLGVLGLLS